MIKRKNSTNNKFDLLDKSNYNVSIKVRKSNTNKTLFTNAFDSVNYPFSEEDEFLINYQHWKGKINELKELVGNQFIEIGILYKS